MFFKSDTNKAASRKIDAQTQQVLELEAQKQKLLMEKEQMSLELDNIRQRNEMELEKAKHKHELKLESEKAVFEREKEIWEKEKQELIDRATREREEFEKKLKAEQELKTQEAITLTKLEAQQKVKQAEIDKERAVNDLKTKYAEDLSKVKSDASEEYYNKLTKAFEEIQLNGDKNSKFVQEMALKIFDKMPSPKVGVGVDVNASPQLKSATQEGA